MKLEPSNSLPKRLGDAAKRVARGAAINFLVALSFEFIRIGLDELSKLDAEEGK